MFSIDDLKGVIPPIITPVDENEKVDDEGLKRVIDYVLEGGVHGIFVLGSNGEFYALNEASQKKAVEITVAHVGKRVPVYAGIGAITTSACIKTAQMAEAAGADAVTLLTPMFINPNEEEMLHHFKAVADAIKIPVILYNNPGKTTNNISPALLRKLAQVENIIGVKNTSLDFAQTIEYIRVTEDISSFKVLSGTDYYIYGTLAYGGVGCVAGTANVAPKLVVSIYEKYMAGDLKGAMEDQYKLIPLRNTYSYGSFPVVMKDCMNLLGLKVGHPIKPIDHCSESRINDIRKVLVDLDLIEPSI